MRLGLEAGLDTLDLAIELGIKGISIDGQSLIANGVEATLGPLQEKGLEPCQIGAFNYNPLADDNSNKLLEQLIPLTAKTGCRHITIGPGNYHPSGFGHYDIRNFTDTAIDTIAQALKPMVVLAEKHDVFLTVEAYLKGTIRSPETFKALHNRIDSNHLRCNIDPSSLYNGLHDFLNPTPLIRSTIAGLSDHIGLIHLKEVIVEEGFHLKMGLAPIGSGNTDWADMLKSVYPHTTRDQWIIIEHCLSADEARNSVKLIREAAVLADIEIR